MEAVSEEREDLRIYCDGIHRGKMRHGAGKKMWTDWLMHTVKGSSLAGAGWVDCAGNRSQCHIRGEQTIMRAEMAVKRTAPDEELTLFTDLLARLWIIK